MKKKISSTEIANNESYNLRAITDFKNYWLRLKPDITRPGNGLHFVAKITYSCPARPTVVAQTDVRISLSGYSPGVINIGETEGLSNENYHLQILPGFGQYKFKKSGALLISDKSPKMGGEYTIRIEVLGVPTKS